MHPKKGISELLHSWKYIQEKYSDWELLICGYDEDNYKKEIIEIIKRLKLKRVILKEFVTGKNKDKLYKSSDIFILLSHSENFGLAIAEALSFCIPVITTKNTPWIKINKYNCGWCIDLKINKVVNTLHKAFELHSKQRRVMGQNGRKWMIKDFSDQIIGLKMHNVYKKILREKTLSKKKFK